MADGNREWREHLVHGRARILIESLEAVETRGRGVHKQNISIGRAGVMPQNCMGAHRHEQRATCSRQEVSQGRGGILNQTE